MSDFSEKFKKFFNKSVEVSKDALSKAGTAVQDFGDKSKLRIEIKQLENKLQKEYAKIGINVFEYFDKTEESLVKNNDILTDSFEEIFRINAEIQKKNAELDEIKEKQPEN